MTSKGRLFAKALVESPTMTNILSSVTVGSGTQIFSTIKVATSNDLPASANVGDQAYVVDINSLLAWNGSSWAAISGGSSVTVSATAPSSPSEGDTWFNSELLETYVYYGTTWVLSNAPVYTTSSVSSGGGVTSYDSSGLFPSSNSAGDLAFTKDTKSLYIWDGIEWDRMHTHADQSPVWTQEPEITYDLGMGDSANISVSATDPEGFGITYTYNTSPPDVTAFANITQTGNAFTITTTTDSNYIGNVFLFRVSASDGIKTSSRTSTVTVGYQNDTIQHAIANGALYNSIVSWNIAPGIVKDAYLSMDGWVLYSSFSTDNSMNAVNYPALNGNNILIPDLATYGYTQGGTWDGYSDGVNTLDVSQYPRRPEMLEYWGSGATSAELQLTTFNGPASTNAVRVVWGAGSTLTTFTGDCRLYVNTALIRGSITNNTTYTDDVVLDLQGSTPYVSVYEGNGDIVGISQIWIKF